MHVLIFRWVAKSLVMAGLVKRVLVQLSYAIGISEPLNITIFSHGTSKISEADLLKVCVTQALAFCFPPICVSQPPTLNPSPRDLAFNSKLIYLPLKVVRHNFDLRPGKIVQELDLKKPIYQQTSCYGHFGRDIFSWEQPKNLDLSIVTIPPEPPRRRKRTDSACI